MKKLVLILLSAAIVMNFIGCKDSKQKIDVPQGVETQLEVPDVYDMKNIDDVVKLSILSENKGAYGEGECVGEGHIILDTAEVTNKYNAKAGTTFWEAYTLATYGEYGFQNGVFCGVSGSGVIPVRITLSKNSDGKYSLIEYKEAMDGSEFTKSIKEMFPVKWWHRAISTTDEDSKVCREQEEKYAKEYLESINREAEVAKNGPFNRKLANMNVSVSNNLMDYFYEYPYWIGTEEKIEDGVRYVYEKEWIDKGNGDGIVTFKKYKYENKEIIDETVIEVKNGETNYLKGKVRTGRGK